MVLGVLLDVVEVVDRAVAGADVEAAEAAQGLLQPGLDLAQRRFPVPPVSPSACTVAMAEDSEQPVPWLLRVGTRSPGTTTTSWASSPPVLTSASGQPPSARSTRAAPGRRRGGRP